MPDDNGGLIGAARERVAEIEAEIDAIRAEMQARVAERAPLLASNDPDHIARAEALTTAIQRLQQELPIPNAEPGAWRPPVQQRLETASAELEHLRRMRWELGRDLDGLHKLAAHIGDRLPELRAAIRTAHDAMRAMRWPTLALGHQADDHLRELGRLRAWLDERAGELAAIPARERRLGELGDDPDYRPATWRPRWYDDPDGDNGAR